MSQYDEAYAEWSANRTPENMAKLVNAFAPTINSEIMRFEGPKPLLRSRARVLTINAIKTYNPAAGAKLQSWVVTNLQPLSRYGKRLRDVYSPEVAARQAAAIDRRRKEFVDEYGRDPTDEELADEMGMTAKRVAEVRKMAVPSVAASQFDDYVSADGDVGTAPGVVQPSKVPFAQEAAYMSLDDNKKSVFDMLTGLHGQKRLPAKEVAKRMGVSSSAISQQAKSISDLITDIVNRG
jgi:RNA polymerase primary sigma factor